MKKYNFLFLLLAIVACTPPDPVPPSSCDMKTQIKGIWYGSPTSTVLMYKFDETQLRVWNNGVLTAETDLVYDCEAERLYYQWPYQYDEIRPVVTETELTLYQILNGGVFTLKLYK